jgi:hypothetical protein
MDACSARQCGALQIRKPWTQTPDHLNYNSLHRPDSPYSHRILNTTTMAIELAPITLPASASASVFDSNFGREVKGVNPGELTLEQFKEIETALYTVCLGPVSPSVEMPMTYLIRSMEFSCSETCLLLRNNSML